jgi:hypothetical protein
VVDVTPRCAFTLAVAPTPPTCATATKQEQETTLVAFDAQQLRAHRHRLPAWVAYHAVDGYFAKQKGSVLKVERAMLTPHVHRQRE